MAPLWVVRIVYLAYNSMQNCGMPSPPFVTWAQGFSIQTVGEDLFLSSPNFVQKNGLLLGGKIFILVFIIYKFSDFPGPPFRKSCVCFCVLCNYKCFQYDDQLRPSRDLNSLSGLSTTILCDLDFVR